jgi:hypothetical protein
LRIIPTTNYFVVNFLFFVQKLTTFSDKIGKKENKKGGVRERERKREKVCVCVCERERERERYRESERDENKQQKNRADVFEVFSIME